MVLVERANPTDRLDIERLIAAYLTSEGVKPRPERITWAVEQVMKNRVGGLILVGREKKTVVGVALAVYSPSAELGRLLIVNDFFVDPGWRREGVRVQVDLGSLRDAVEAVRLQPHVEPLPVVKGLECDQVEGLALGSVPEGDHCRLDRRERHPPRKRGLHRTPHAPYATFADTSE